MCNNYHYTPNDHGYHCCISSSLLWPVSCKPICIFISWGWVKTYYYHIWKNQHPLTSYFRYHPGARVLTHNLIKTHPIATYSTRSSQRNIAQGPFCSRSLQYCCVSLWKATPLQAVPQWPAWCESHCYPKQKKGQQLKKRGLISWEI